MPLFSAKCSYWNKTDAYLPASIFKNMKQTRRIRDLLE